VLGHFMAITIRKYFSTMSKFSETLSIKIEVLGLLLQSDEKVY
jgi:hypothetical protein